MTNAKEEVYMGSSYYHVASIRNMRPHPVVEMNPETARGLGLAEGDWVTIETGVGSCRQKLSFNKDVDPRVVIATFNSWVPEKPDDLYGTFTVNLNMVTPSGPDYDPATGAVTLRGVPCKVYRAAENQPVLCCLVCPAAEGRKEMSAEGERT